MTTPKLSLIQEEHCTILGLIQLNYGNAQWDKTNFFFLCSLHGQLYAYIQQIKLDKCLYYKFSIHVGHCSLSYIMVIQSEIKQNLSFDAAYMVRIELIFNN